MTITQIQTTKRKRLSVYVDGEFLFAVESDAWYSSGLKEGSEVTEEQLNSLLKDSRLIEAKRRAFNMLSARDYSGEQLAERIARKTGAESAHQAVERMQQLGLVDDEKYAQRCAVGLFEKGYAQRRIRFELQKRRLPVEVIDNALEEMSEKVRKSMREALEQKSEASAPASAKAVAAVSEDAPKSRTAKSALDVEVESN